MANKLRLSILTADVLSTPFLLLLAFFFGGKWAPGYFWMGYLYYAPIAVITALLWMAMFHALRLDGFGGGWHLPAVISRVFVGVTAVTLLSSALAFLTRILYSRLLIGRLAIFMFVSFVVIRCLVRAGVTSRVRSGGANRVVILGYGHVALEIASKIRNHPELMYEFVGFLNPLGSEAIPEPGAAEPQSTSGIGVIPLLQREGVSEVIVASSETTNSSELRKLIANFRAAGIRVALVPQWYELYISRTELTEVDGLPLVHLQDHNPDALAQSAKTVFDFVIAGVFLVLCSPVLIVASVYVYLRTGRAFRTEERGGFRGATINIYRLNLDRRVQHSNRIDRMLVEMSITELPQLWNVLTGDMALVGPRPESLERVRHYSDWQRQRLTVKPGITGLAQVQGLREQHASEDKARFDLQYILHASPLLDLALIVQTVWTLLGRLWKKSLAQAIEAPRHVPVTAQEMKVEVANADRS